MLESLINLMQIIIGIIGGFAVVYSLVRLAAIAWHRTKREYDTLEEQPEREQPEREHPEREHPERE
jgi:hypothetical protein